MQKVQVQYNADFAILAGNRRAQAGVMVLPPGFSTGGPDNLHRGADQWLYVARGQGELILNGKPHKLTANMLVLIEQGEAHEIRNTGSEPLETLNFYTPPAFDKEGEPLPAGESH